MGVTVTVIYESTKIQTVVFVLTAGLCQANLATLARWLMRPTEGEAKLMLTVRVNDNLLIIDISNRYVVELNLASPNVKAAFLMFFDRIFNYSDRSNVFVQSA